MRYLLILLAAGVFLPLSAQSSVKADSVWLVNNYTKKEVYIPMRDGTRLFTAIYEPKAGGKHPILMNRTPYAISPYGKGKFKGFWNFHYMGYFRRQYIIVLQDVRGRMMSEGEFMDVRPFKPNKKGKETDEASDTYDAIDWLIKNVRNNNGNVGIYGISYPGYYATMGALSGHPAMKAASPQAPVTEWFIGDDFHHNGAFMEMDAFNFYSNFGKPRPKPTTEWGAGYQFPNKDGYKFYLEAGPLKSLAKLMGDSIKFWKELYDHPNYDEWWQVRNTRKYAGHIPAGTATLVVGGLFDAEDCYGAWELYKAIEKKASNNNKLVMGPWSHGGWAKFTGERLGNVEFGAKTSKWYQDNVEIPYFEYYLRGKGDINKIPEASIFFTGANQWQTFNQWPPAGRQNRNLYFHTDGTLSFSAPGGGDYDEYISDPAKPVPYTEDVHFKRTAEYMTDDQRFASRRPDVLTYATGILQEDLKVAGPVVAGLFTSISTTDADFVVKLIDVFPDDFSYGQQGGNTSYPMGGYQMLVRGEVMRGRYRNSFEFPEAFTPGRVTEVTYKLPDVAHVFKKGHRVMVQVQSSWFPLVDRNPQQFVNIYECGRAAFVPSRIRIHAGAAYPSHVVLPVVQ